VESSVIESDAAAMALLDRARRLTSGRAMQSLTVWLWREMALRLPQAGLDDAVDVSRADVVVRQGARAWDRFASQCGGAPVWFLGAPGAWAGNLRRDAVVPGAGDFDLVCRSRRMCAFVSHDYPESPVITYEQRVW